MSDEVELRLRRIHSSLTVSTFRARQIGWSLAAFGSAAMLSIAVGLPPVPAVLCLIGGPLLTVLLLEQQLVNASADWQRRVFLELPVVSEQLGMLLGAGFSLGSALSRLAQRGRGCCATDLAVVCGRIRQGLPEIEALREWSRTVDVAAVTRLVGVLALNRDGGDLGRLIAEESRSVRRDAQRELIETAERRGAAGVDPRHGGHPRARRAVPGRALHRSDAAVHLGLSPTTERLPMRSAEFLAATIRSRAHGIDPRHPHHRARHGDRLVGDRGEGVISAAIAVLIMAFLGAAMWIGFQRMWQTTEATTQDRVEQIGQE